MTAILVSSLDAIRSLDSSSMYTVMAETHLVARSRDLDVALAFATVGTTLYCNGREVLVDTTA